MSPFRSKRLSTPSRFWALVCVLLVLTLDVLAASPAAHEWIHHGTDQAAQDSDNGIDGHDCVVTKFAHGHSGTSIAPVVLAFAALRQIATLPALDAQGISAPAFFLPHSCGPPLA